MQGAHYLLSSIGFAALIFSVDAAAENYYVDPAGANGAFTTVQAAVDAVTGATELNRANIFIAPGDYHELLTIAKPYVSLIGTGDSADAVTIEFARTVVTSPVLDLGPAVLIDSDATAFMARNLTFENSTPDRNVVQALAVESSADRAIFDQVQFLGYQDTLLTDNSSRQYFLNSFVTAIPITFLATRPRCSIGARFRAPTMAISRLRIRNARLRTASSFWIARWSPDRTAVKLEAMAPIRARARSISAVPGCGICQASCRA